MRDARTVHDAQSPARACCIGARWRREPLPRAAPTEPSAIPRSGMRPSARPVPRRPTIRSRTGGTTSTPTSASRESSGPNARSARARTHARQARRELSSSNESSPRRKRHRPTLLGKEKPPRGQGSGDRGRELERAPKKTSSTTPALAVAEALPPRRLRSAHKSRFAFSSSRCVRWMALPAVPAGWKPAATMGTVGP